MTRRTCGHGRDLHVPCPACALRVNPQDYWELRRLANAMKRARRKRGVR